ncbi:hypothetical protein [Alkalilimnicola ehrlichii]|uniref:hypothetical protein n=1 Tax=Alkalilimnicola ehrlichii TaxID=351052 RepID=UPI0015F24E09|nr:hypothetical protein [Alkalilimnicola ehrlichii]
MRVLGYTLLLFFLVGLAGCEVIATIFEAGVWVGVVGILLIVIVVWLLYAILRR